MRTHTETGNRVQHVLQLALPHAAEHFEEAKTLTSNYASQKFILIHSLMGNTHLKKAHLSHPKQYAPNWFINKHEIKALPFSMKWIALAWYLLACYMIRFLFEKSTIKFFTKCWEQGYSQCWWLWFRRRTQGYLGSWTLCEMLASSLPDEFPGWVSPAGDSPVSHAVLLWVLSKMLSKTNKTRCIYLGSKYSNN